MSSVHHLHGEFWEVRVRGERRGREHGGRETGGRRKSEEMREGKGEVIYGRKRRERKRKVEGEGGDGGGVCTLVITWHLADNSL